ncbi:hypothetical protein BY996DRAFT_6409110 [Phakopsora pachyrhizi]|nr:hypothetical protein BY996DRAFT_6409110 [Phakopsora pachyrhizi]
MINPLGYDRGTFDSLKVPQPVLLVDSQRSLKTGGEHEEDQRRYQLTHVLNNDDTDDGERSFFEEDPGDDDQVVNEPEGGTLQERELRRKIRVSIGAAVLVGTVGCSYLMMNVSVVLNFFKYPEVTSIGRMMVIQIQWSTYSWNASVGIIYSTLVLLNFEIISKKDEDTQDNKKKTNEFKVHNLNYLTNHCKVLKIKKSRIFY